MNFAVKGFQPTDLPVSITTSGYPSIRGSDQISGASSFSRVLERTSAKESSTDRQTNDLRQQSAVKEDRTQKENNQTNAAPPIRQDHQTDRRADHTEKKEQIDQDPAASDGSMTQTAAAHAVAQQANVEQTAASDKTPKSEVTITLSLTGLGDDVTVSLEGLPEELISALLSACSDAPTVAQAVTQGVTLGSAKKVESSALDESGLEPLSRGIEKLSSLSSGIGSLASLSGSSAKLTVKMPIDQADPKNSVNEIFSMVQALVGALQNNSSSTVDLRQVQILISDPKTLDPQVADPNRSLPTTPDLLAYLLPKETPIDGASANQSPNATFKNIIAQPSPQPLQTTTSAPDGATGMNSIPDSVSEVKLPKGTDLTEALLSKVKMVVSSPGVAEATNGTAEKATSPSSEEKGNSSFPEQGVFMQADARMQGPPAEVSRAASFGNVVANRLAAVAEQIGARERPLDITLRLNVEGGESLMVGLKEQAGKVVVQVRSADQNIVGFFESQKETIVRNLEAKQISSSISVSPIEDDVTKRQGRGHTKNMWERRREPANPYIKTLI